MKDPGACTKLVMRHLPPTLSEGGLLEQIDARFAGRYNWFVFRPGKTSHRNQLYSRAYIQLKRPEDVFEFADFFDGHVFVNEKGTQFKTVVEYAPSQWVPKASFKKDGREGTLYKDPEYLEFLETLSKPIENLPSAEVQLERREAERAGTTKDNIIVTPLMEYVRQKRAAKGGPQRSTSLSRKLGGRARGVSAASVNAAVNKRGLEKSRLSTATYVLRDSTRIPSSKDKSTYVSLPQREQQQRRDNDLSTDKSRKDVIEGKDRKMLPEPIVHAVTSTEAIEDEAGASMQNVQELTVISNEEMTAGGDGTGEAGKRKVLLTREREDFSNALAVGASLVPNSVDIGVQLQRRQAPLIKCASTAQQPGGALHQQGVSSPGRGSAGTVSIKQNQRRESSGRIGRGMISTKDLQLPLMSSNVEQQNQLPVPYGEKDKRLPRPPGLRSSSSLISSNTLSDIDGKNFQDDKSNHTTLKDSFGLVTIVERQDRRTRNKDRPDRPVWTPRRRSDGPTASDASLPSSEPLVPTRFQIVPESVLKLEKTEKGSTSRQVVKSGFVEKLMDDNLQGESFGDNSPLSGRSRHSELVGFQAARTGRLNTVGMVPALESPSNQGELKSEILTSNGGGSIEAHGNGRTTLVTGENGNHRQLLRRPMAPVTKELDGTSVLAESKSSKRGGALGYGGQEKQVWVAIQKSGSGS